MGMTIWVNYLKDGTVTSDEADKSAMFRHLNKLDQLCKRSRIRKLSDFLDTTDLEANVDDGTQAEGSTWDLMAQKGNWFSPEAGIEVLSALIRQLEEKPIRFGWLTDNYDWVLMDLKECLASIENAGEKEARFHLGVVE